MDTTEFGDGQGGPLSAGRRVEGGQPAGAGGWMVDPMTPPKKKNPYIFYPKDRRRTNVLWERFNVATLDRRRLEDPYERMLVEDWRRCKSLGVNPELQAADVLPEDDLQRTMEEKSFLLDKARMALDRVRDVLEGVPGILIFTDERGTILYVTGDPKVRVKAADLSNLTEGGQWSEQRAGTNGIGTAIAKRMPVHVYSSEHFCEGWHKWTCAGAPVLDPFRNDVLGVVDFTTFESDFRLEALALSQSLASNIAGELRVQIELERLQIIHHYSIYSARYPGDGVVAYDRLGRLVRASPGVDLERYGVLPGDLAVLDQPPKEVRQVFVPGTREAIGTLLVVERPRKVSLSLPSGRPASPDVESFGDFVTASEPVKRVLHRIQKIIPTDLNILLIGETGTGKELIASFIHSRSPRRDGPFVAVNCGAINKELFESKFFGYERGGFTGADPRGRRGLFEAADGGTLFLDEIGEMPPDIQAGLLRVLETGRFRRIGSEREHTTNCRIIAATNRPLLRAVEEGTFRSDLYYRLSVVKAVIPPLRDRPEDVPILIDHTMRRFCERHGMPPKTFTAEAMAVLTAHRWPGNVRELRNVVESALVCAEEAVTPEDLPAEILSATAERDTGPAPEAPAPRPEGTPPGAAGLSVRENERRLILTALRKYKKVSLAARALGMSRSTLYRRLEEHGIDHREVVAGRNGQR
ncbi:MAG: sigma-54-dependent Fis family transcriptional regulator [Deferrisomatales bacterium]